MPQQTTEVFFRPEPLSCQRVTIPAEIYNLARLLLTRSASDCCFVPIRSMQYLAVISREEILFVDSQDYAVKDGEGGRLVTLAWQTGHTGARTSLDEPVLIEVIYFKPDGEATQRRLLGEFRLALKALQQRAGAAAPPGQARIIPI